MRPRSSIANTKFIYPSLNGLRAISILLVVCSHLSSRQGIFDRLFTHSWLRPCLALITDGNLGVNIFFVISGFLITSLLLKEEEQRQQISLKDFFIRRTLRIFPAYYFLLGCYLLLQFANLITIPPAAWFTAITYTKYFNTELNWNTGHLWSLSVEEHFYLLWPFIFKLAKQLRKKLLIAVLFALPLFRLFLHHYPIAWINEFNFLLRIDTIAIGCLLAFHQQKITVILAKHWLHYLLMALAILAFLRYLPSLQKESQWLALLHLLCYQPLINLAISVILSYVVFGPRKIIHWLLNTPIFNFIGLLSYSIYLWQQFFIGDNNLTITRFPQNLGFLFMMALFSYFIIEKPFLKLKDRFSGRAS